MISFVINHTPWRPERVAQLAKMRSALGYPRQNYGMLINDVDYRGCDWQAAKVEWAIRQWQWSLMTGAHHHLFMTDDLEIAPRFWEIVDAILEVAPNEVIGFLSNHPQGPRLSHDEWRWYRCNAWIVGPCYLVPHHILEEFLTWFEALPDGPHTTPGTKAYRNDDSSLNEFLTHTGRTSLHPLPTIIDHGGDPALPSTVGHGDQYSRPRVLWYQTRDPFKPDLEWGGAWIPRAFPIEEMVTPAWWRMRGGPAAAPLLALPQ